MSMDWPTAWRAAAKLYRLRIREMGNENLEHLRKFAGWKARAEEAERHALDLAAAVTHLKRVVAELEAIISNGDNKRE